MIKMKSRHIAIFTVFIILLSIPMVNAVKPKRVLFYEANTKYSIDDEYSEFKKALEDKGYVVERIGIVLTSEVLKNRNPDVLVVAGLGGKSGLTSGELFAIFKFVMQDGNGLLIMPPSGKSSVDASNTLATAFGMTLDSAVLENTVKPVVKSGVPETDNTHFVLKSGSFNRGDELVRLILQGVNELAFFGGYGITIMEGSDAKYVVRGDYETHSPDSTIFTKGGLPPLVVASPVGKGLVIVASSAEMFTDAHVDTTQYKYDNLRFAVNMVDWLRSCPPPENLTCDELAIRAMLLIAEKEMINESLTDCQVKLKNETARYKNLGVEYTKKETELVQCLEGGKLLGIDYIVWAVGLLAVGIIILAIILAGKKGKALKEGEEEEMGALGYEFEEDLGEEELSEGGG